MQAGSRLSRPGVHCVAVGPRTVHKQRAELLPALSTALSISWIASDPSQARGRPLSRSDCQNDRVRRRLPSSARNRHRGKGERAQQGAEGGSGSVAGSVGCPDRGGLQKPVAR